MIDLYERIDDNFYWEEPEEYLYVVEMTEYDVTKLISESVIEDYRSMPDLYQIVFEGYKSDVEREFGLTIKERYIAR